jgi:PilZ domain
VFIGWTRRCHDSRGVIKLTIDAKEKHRADRTGPFGSGSVWFGNERRRLLRVEVDEAAYVSSGGASTRCRVLNISTEGAAIDVPNAAYIPQRFHLMTEKDRVIRKCRIVWIQQNRIGVAFETESGS